jgi:hypothetical protein
VNGRSTASSGAPTSTDDSDLAKSWKFEDNPKSKALIPDDFLKSDWVHDVLNPPSKKVRLDDNDNDNVDANATTFPSPLQPKFQTFLPLKLVKRSITGAKLFRTPPTCMPTTFEHISSVSPKITSQLDTQMKGLISDLKVLSKHLSSPRPFTLSRLSWEEIDRVVNDLHRLVEIPQRGVDAAREEMTPNEIKTKEEREVRLKIITALRAGHQHIA